MKGTEKKERNSNKNQIKPDQTKPNRNIYKPIKHDDHMQSDDLL